ncbi:MAG: carbon starvation protein A [Gemmatimonadota bacterium]|nr:carbon starvation protein A [Gemmatimonadota bacterium]
MRLLPWIPVALAGAAGWGRLALARGETVSAAWLVIAAICTYLIGYRFYSRIVTEKVFALTNQRATPAERLNNGRDFVPTTRWVLFGHHFAAISGAGPLIGPVLAAQFGYLPGTIWIVAGVVLAGAVQDLIIMIGSMRRDGKSLGQMARDEIGPFAGVSAMIAIFAIMIILLAVLALVVVNALRDSPWGLFTIACTIPIAVVMGFWMRHWRPGHNGEATILGLALLFLALIGGQQVAASPTLAPLFTWSPVSLALALGGYGFVASVLPVWMLLAPRDYLSTFMKIGTIALLAITIVIAMPELKLPAVTPFVDGTGPIFAGKLFPFAFITIACGAISGFHALVASGTTPKMLRQERDARLVGYGGMLTESFVAIMAMCAAAVLDPGVYFAINVPLGRLGGDAVAAAETIRGWGFTVTPEQMSALARGVGESTLLGRTGGAPSLAVGMATLFSGAFGGHLLALWYHFAIMFEALFILTTIDAGTRVGRFMMQELAGHLWAPMGRTSWYPSVILSSLLVVLGWGYFLVQGVLDPLGGINSLWPLFGISNQLLAAVALCVGTTLILKAGKRRYAWLTLAPLAWLLIVTLSASYYKIFSPERRVGFLADAAAVAADVASGAVDPATGARLIFNDRLNTAVAAIFVTVVLAVVLSSAAAWIRLARSNAVDTTNEAEAVASAYAN